MLELDTQLIHYDTSSTWYAQELTLRKKILRTPLGLTLTDNDTITDSQSEHFGIVSAPHSPVTPPQLIACVILTPQNATHYKLRQMAVASEYHGQGLGRRLIAHVEKYLLTLGVTELTMHARQSALDFYIKLGYHTVGETFTEQTIPHVRMTKRLTS